MFNVETQGVNANLVYTVGERDEFDGLALGMISNNKIKGVIPVVFSQMDENRFLSYNISGKTSLSEYFKGNVQKRKMLNVLAGISEAIMASEEYMVDTSLFVLDPNYIFIDFLTEEVGLICLPIVNSNIGFDNLSMFFKQLVCGTQIDLSENCDYIAKLISFFNIDKAFSISEFRLFVETLNSSSSAVSPASYQPAPAPVAYQQPEAPKSNTTVISQAAGVASNPAPSNPQPSFAAPASMPQTPPVAGNSAPPVPAAKPSKKNAKDKKKAKAEAQAPVAQLPDGEKPMSIFTLLTKYSKENLEIYKAQKSAAQGGKAPAAEKPKKDSAKKKKEVVASFAVPNQPAPMKAPAPVAAPSKPASMQVNVPNVSQAPQVPDSIPKYTPGSMDVKSASFGETTVLGVAPTAGETTVLNAVAAKPMPYLIRMKNNERIVIDKPGFRIGKERSYVDYFIADNPAISRSHADIISNSRGYFIIDRNSTNHTFVNGVAIQSESEVKIEPGCKIRLANEEFEFVIG